MKLALWLPSVTGGQLSPITTLLSVSLDPIRVQGNSGTVPRNVYVSSDPTLKKRVKTGCELGVKVELVFQKNHRKDAKSPINKGFITVSSEKRWGVTVSSTFLTLHPKTDIYLIFKAIVLVFIEKIYPNLGSIYDLWISNSHPLVFFGWKTLSPISTHSRFSR